MHTATADTADRSLFSNKANASHYKTMLTNTRALILHIHLIKFERSGCCPWLMCRQALWRAANCLDHTARRVAHSRPHFLMNNICGLRNKPKFLLKILNIQASVHDRRAVLPFREHWACDSVTATSSPVYSKISCLSLCATSCFQRRLTFLPPGFVSTSTIS